MIARYRDRGFALYFRGDAGFAKPELYELLEAENMAFPSASRPTRSCKNGSGIC